MNIKRFVQVLIVNLHLCVIEISSSVTRTFITTLGIFLGIATLLVNLAFVRGMDDDLLADMERIGGLNIITLRKVEPRTTQERKLFQRSPGLSFVSAEAVVKKIQYVSSIIHSNEIGWNRCSGEGNQTWGYLIAADLNYFSMYNYHLSKGRWLSESDINKCSSVCIIGKDLAEKLSLGPDPIGKRISVRSYSLTIVGLFEANSILSRRKVECCIPFSLYTKRFENSDKNLNSISIVLSSSDYVEVAKTELLHYFKSAHRGVIDFEIESSADQIREMRATSVAMKMIFYCIAGISLLVGGISIMNIMFATTEERIREIGIRKALGARRYDIFMQFMLEALFVCCFGGVPGMVLGAAIMFTPDGIFPYNPRLTLYDISISFGFTLSVGIISGIFPALKAANMQPIEAIRY